MENKNVVHINNEGGNKISVSIELDNGRLLQSLDRINDAGFIKDLYCYQINEYYVDGKIFTEPQINHRLDVWTDRLNHGDVFVPLIYSENGQKIAMINPGHGKINSVNAEQIDSEIAVIVKDDFKATGQMSNLLDSTDIAAIFYNDAYENQRKMYLGQDKQGFDQYLPFSGVAYATISPYAYDGIALLEKAHFEPAINEDGQKEIFDVDMHGIQAERYIYYRDFSGEDHTLDYSIFK